MLRSLRLKHNPQGRFVMKLRISLTVVLLVALTGEIHAYKPSRPGQDSASQVRLLSERLKGYKNRLKDLQQQLKNPKTTTTMTTGGKKPAQINTDPRYISRQILDLKRVISETEEQIKEHKENIKRGELLKQQQERGRLERQKDRSKIKTKGEAELQLASLQQELDKAIAAEELAQSHGDDSMMMDMSSKASDLKIRISELMGFIYNKWGAADLARKASEGKAAAQIEPENFKQMSVKELKKRMSKAMGDLKKEKANLANAQKEDLINDQTIDAIRSGIERLNAIIKQIKAAIKAKM